jgi:hypothetical protein
VAFGPRHQPSAVGFAAADGRLPVLGPDSHKPSE